VTGRLFKVEASGNDFLLGVGGWAETLAASPGAVAKLCDRRRGIGADGVLAVEVVAAERARLRYRNADGSQARFCGNGSRCAARAAVELLGLPSRLTLETGWAPIRAEVDGSSVTLELPALEAPARAMDLVTADARWRGFWLEVGVPHVVLPVDDLDAVDLGRISPPLRRHPDLGPDGANIDFVATDGAGAIALRTFERGVEGETLCCGSGVVAAALVAMASGASRRVVVRPRSNDVLTVELTGDPLTAPIRFTGPTRFVAEVGPTAELLAELHGGS
jgi:diaminopimelate epimerase